MRYEMWAEAVISIFLNVLFTVHFFVHDLQLLTLCSPLFNPQSPIPNHQSPITNPQSPITNRQLPITRYPPRWALAQSRPQQYHPAFEKQTGPPPRRLSHASSGGRTSRDRSGSTSPC